MSESGFPNYNKLIFGEIPDALNANPDDFCRITHSQVVKSQPGGYKFCLNARLIFCVSMAPRGKLGY